jgi:hypothetical protein
MVEETEDRYKFPHLASLQASKTYWDGLSAKGVQTMWYDIHAKELGDYKNDALSIGLPAMLIVSPSGHVLKVKSIPPTTTGVDDILKEVFKAGS